MQKFITQTFEETQMAGQNFAHEILAQKPLPAGRQVTKHAVVLELSGDLGAGKTTFLQGFAKGLGIGEVVNSPTFIIMKKFNIPQAKKRAILQNVKLYKSQYRYFFHFDCYRLENPEEILQLGFKEIISDPKNIVAIEWPEKVSKILPQDAISINFTHSGENKRELAISR